MIDTFNKIPNPEHITWKLIPFISEAFNLTFSFVLNFYCVIPPRKDA